MQGIGRAVSAARGQGVKGAVALIAALCVGCSSVPYTQPPTQGLHGLHIINTGPFPCDGKLRWWYWDNPYDKPLQVMIVRQWTGLDYGLESDTHVESYVVGPAPGKVPLELLTIQQLDNYKHRSFEQERWVSFAPSYMEVPADGGIQTLSTCNPSTGGTDVHVLVEIWYN